MIKPLEIKTAHNCKCSCGKIYSIYGSNLINGFTTKCIKCAARKYVGELSSTAFSKIKSNAKKRGILFNITQEDIWEKFLEQDRKCVFTGVELTWQDGAKGKLGTASVDRKDSSAEYTKDNIQIVHKDVNMMKGSRSDKEFLEICKTIVEYDLEKSSNDS